ncbi:Endonuclease/exonuclease/phosphatase family protein [Pelomyxa schiedti]|nr:Endonuclease/exonuclease/phosphatase family protein [Pelomyxa schiedti]
MTERLVVTSAVVVVPPEDQWGQIQQIRQKHDKAYSRWMPHINMLYPFVPDAAFDAAVGRIQKAVSHLQPFTVTFQEQSFFEHGPSSCTLFANPTTNPPEALQTLEKALVEAFPLCTDLSTREGGFHPHLTLGQWRGKAATEAFMRTSKWSPITFTVSEIHFISRTAATPFSIKKTVRLGESSTSTSVLPVLEETSHDEPTQEETVESTETSAEKPETSTESAAATPEPTTSTAVSTKPTPPPPVKQTPKFTRVGADPIACEDAPEKRCVSKVHSWLVRNPNQRPKTREKFVQTIKKFCICSYQVTEDHLVKHLKDVNLLHTNGDKVNIAKRAVRASELHGPTTETAHPEILALFELKAREWCLSQQFPPKTRAPLMNAIQQLTKHRESIPPHTILDTLISDGYITETEAHDLTYTF